MSLQWTGLGEKVEAAIRVVVSIIRSGVNWHKEWEILPCGTANGAQEIAM